MKIKDDTPKLLEVTPRLDGCHSWRLCKEDAGVDLLQASIDHLFGNPPTISTAQQLKGKRLKLGFLCEKPGVTIDRSLFSIPKDVVYCEWYYDNQEVVREVNGYFEKIGYYISYL